MKNNNPIYSSVVKQIQKQIEFSSRVVEPVLTAQNLYSSIINNSTDTMRESMMSTIKVGLDAVRICYYSEALKANSLLANEMIVPITKNLEVLNSLKASYQSAFDALQALQNNYITDAERIVDIYEDINFQTFLDIDAESEDNECIRNISIDEFKEALNSIDFDVDPTESVKVYSNCTFIIMNSNNPKIKNAYFNKFIDIIKQAIEKAAISTIYIVIMIFLYKLIEKYEIFNELLKFISEHSELF